METLAAYNGNKSKTADILGIGRKTLHRKLDEFAANSSNMPDADATKSGVEQTGDMLNPQAPNKTGR